MSLNLGVYPGFEELTLEPGQVYEGTIKVVNNDPDGTEPVSFFLSTAPVSADESGYATNFSSQSDRTSISEWITFEERESEVNPMTAKTVHYTIRVPEDAISGGQYGAIVVRLNEDSVSSDGVHIVPVYQVAHIIYATVSGDLDYSGEITANQINSIFIGKQISSSVTATNSGNVHTDVTTTIRVYGLFSDTEIYSTEENPSSSTVIPGTSLTKINLWDNTPTVGIFRVVQTAQIVDDISTVSRIVFVAPWWFIIVWISFLISCVIWIISRKGWRLAARRNAKKQSSPRISR